MGLNKMLKQGIENEQEQLEKASQPTKSETKEKTKITELEAKTIEKKENKKPEKKKQGGRPTNKEKGIQNRKQYTITLREDTYKLFLETANKEGLSFSVFMERAALKELGNR